MLLFEDTTQFRQLLHLGPKSEAFSADQVAHEERATQNTQELNHNHQNFGKLGMILSTGPLNKK